MQAMPVHSLRDSFSSNTAIDDRSAITGIASMLSDAVPAEESAARRPTARIRSRTRSRRSRRASRHSSRSIASAAAAAASGSSESGSTPSSICHAMKLSMSKLRPRWKYFIAIVPHAQPNPESTAHALGFNSPSQCQGSTTSTSPASASAIATHCMPRTRSPSTGQASSTVQNGIVNTSTAARPAPPSATRHRRRSHVDGRLEEARDRDGDPRFRQQRAPAQHAAPRTARRRRSTCARC